MVQQQNPEFKLVLVGDGGVGRREDAIRVLGEVAVPRRVRAPVARPTGARQRRR